MTERDDTTDQDLERAERIRRLQERRGTAATRSAGARAATPARNGSRPASAPGARGNSGAPARTAGGGRKRRKHYNASRIVLAGLSVTSFFSILAAIGASQPSNPVAAAPAAVAAPSTAGTSTAATGTAGSATPAPHAAATVKPVTRSHGS